MNSKKIFQSLFLINSLLFLFGCNNSTSVSDDSTKIEDISYSGLTTQQIEVVEDFLKEYEQLLKNSDEKFSDETIKQALFIKKREEVQTFLTK